MDVKLAGSEPADVLRFLNDVRDAFDDCTEVVDYPCFKPGLDGEEDEEYEVPMLLPVNVKGVAQHSFGTPCRG